MQIAVGVHLVAHQRQRLAERDRQLVAEAGVDDDVAVVADALDRTDNDAAVGARELDVGAVLRRTIHAQLKQRADRGVVSGLAEDLSVGAQDGCAFVRQQKAEHAAFDGAARRRRDLRRRRRGGGAVVVEAGSGGVRRR